MISRANTESIRPKQTNLIIFNPCLHSLFFLHLPCSPSSLVHQQAQLQRRRETSLSFGWRGHSDPSGPPPDKPLCGSHHEAEVPYCHSSVTTPWHSGFFCSATRTPSSSSCFAFTWWMTSEDSLTQLPHLHVCSEHAVLHTDLALEITRNRSCTAAAKWHTVCRAHRTQGNLQTHHTARH